MLSTPGENLLIFAAIILALILLLAPRFGLIHAIRSRRRDLERIRLEDALKYAYDREDRGQTATLSRLSDLLRISPGKVMALVERMQHAGLATVADGRILLTANGRQYALEIIRAHRLWERYLADETGVNPVKWHALAERREHALTPQQTEELSKRLGHPRFDPHGDPIPTADGELPSEKALPLSRLDAGENARVVHVEDEPDVVYAQLVALGIYPGMELHVDAKSEERIIIMADGRRMAVAPIVAGNVSVQPISEREKEAIEQAHETLADLHDGEAAVVARISHACMGLERRRLMDLGILPGTRVERERRGLTGGLTAYVVRGTRIALRDEQAELISIQPRENTAS